MTERNAEALVDRLFEATVGTLELYAVYIGWRLGLYEALADRPATPGELAERCGLDLRYAREWLEQQAVAGMLDVATESPDPDARSYGLPAEYREVLVDADSTSFVAPFAPMVVGIAGALPDVVEAYRSGAGVPYVKYGADFRDGQGGINRPAFLAEMGDWLGTVPAVDERLSAASGARVADIGCGQGFSTVAIAQAYPHARVDGLDLDAASVDDAAKLAADSGVADRVSFDRVDASGLGDRGPYDLACIFEALHDMARPVDALVAVREVLAPGGALLLMDERVADEFTAPGDEVERMMYGWSVTHCLPASREEQPSAALGTPLRSSKVRELAGEAGFSGCEVLPIENDFFRFYLLTP